MGTTAKHWPSGTALILRDPAIAIGFPDPTGQPPTPVATRGLRFRLPVADGQINDPLTTPYDFRDAYEAPSGRLVQRCTPSLR